LAVFTPVLGNAVSVFTNFSKAMEMSFPFLFNQVPLADLVFLSFLQRDVDRFIAEQKAKDEELRENLKLQMKLIEEYNRPK
jgi:hypothetical protein